MQNRSNIIRYLKKYFSHSANSLPMIKKQELRIDYKAQISIKCKAKKIKFYQISKSLLKAFRPYSGHGHKQQIRVNYVAEISIKRDAKKIKYYQISKNLFEDFGQFAWP